jgi:HK97 family phage major capsid protein
MVNTKELSVLIQEASTLNNKANWTKQDERRNAFLLSAISAVKAGASLQTLDQEFLNEVEQRNGLPITTFKKDSLTREQRSKAEGFRQLALGSERRDNEGAPMLNHFGVYSGAQLGTFVPTEFFDGVFESMKQHDFLFDPESVTFLRTENGRVMTVPTLSDTSHDATVLTEAGATTEVDIADPNQAVLGVWSYASRRWSVSLEAFDDLSTSLSAMNLFQRFTSKALARGIGRDLVLGNGVLKPTGLLTSLANAGVTPVIANGSAANTGGSEAGNTSIGSVDLANALSALDPAYIGPKTAFAMNNSTLNTLRGLVSKFGSPLDIVRDTPDGPTIYGVKVKIAPSLPNIGPSQQPIVLGSFDYWCTRLVTPDDNLGIKVFRESNGLIEQGLIGFRSFCRATGALLWSDINSPCPFVVVQNHS